MNNASIPNSNNLFTILTNMVEGMSDLMTTVFKAKISPKKVDNAKETIKLIIDATSELTDMLNEKLKSVDTKIIDNVKGLFVSLKELVTVFNEVKYTDVLHAYLIMHAIPFLLFKSFLTVVRLMQVIGPTLPFMMVTTKMLQLAIGALVSTVKNLASINAVQIWKAKRNLKKMMKLFGVVKKIGSEKFEGILDFIKRIGKTKDITIKNAIKNMTAIKLFILEAVFTLADLAWLAVIGPFAWLGVKFLKPVLHVAVSAMRYVARHAKDIVLGSLAITLLMTAVTISVAGMLLIGLMIVKGWKLILFGMIGFVGIVAIMTLMCIGLGALMSTGFFELGLIALGLIALALIAFTAALLIFVVAVNLLNNIDIKEDIFIKAVKPLGVLMQYIWDNILLFNPVSMMFALTVVGMIAVMAILVLVAALATILINILMQKADEQTLVDSMIKVIHPWFAFNQYLWDNLAIFNPITIALNLVTVALLTAMSVAVLVMAIMTRLIVAVAKKIDAEEAKTAFVAIIEPYKELMDVVWNDFGIKGTLKLMHTIATLGELVVVAGEVGVIAHVLADIASLKMATEWNEKGKPINYKHLSAQDLANAALNGAGLVQIMAGLFGGKDDKEEITVKLAGGDVTFNPINLSSLEGISRNTKKKMKLLASITKCTGGIAHTLGDIASMRYPVEFDENGNPKKFENITGDVLKEAAMSAANLIKIMTGMFADDPGTVIIGGVPVEIPKIALTDLEELKNKSINKVKAALGAVEPLSSIVDAVYKLACMEVPAEGAKFNPETGKWDNYVKLNDTHITAVTTNMQLIMDSLIKAVQTVLNSKTKLPDEDDVENIGKLFGAVTSPIRTIASIYSENRDMDITKFESMVNSMLQSPLKALSSLRYDPIEMTTRLKHAKEVSDIMEKMSGITASDGVTQITDAHVKFLKQVNNTKLENLKYANSLMANMHKITKDLKGNFDKLADTLNEDIIEQLKEVAKLLDEINNKDVKIGTTGPAPAPNKGIIPIPNADNPKKEDAITALKTALSQMRWKLSVPSGTGTIDVTLSSI